MRRDRPGRLVLGADQTLALGQRVFSKPADAAAARAQLKMLRGRTHELHAALALARDGAIVFEHREVARLTMRDFSDAFLDAYVAAAGSALTASVGGYQVEKIGIQLFERIEGELFHHPRTAAVAAAGFLAAGRMARAMTRIAKWRAFVRVPSS